jgi:hypothetical protein
MIGSWDFNKENGENMKARRLKQIKIIYQPLGPFPPTFLFPSNGLIAPIVLFCSQCWTFLLIFKIIFTYLMYTMENIFHGILKAYLLKYMPRYSLVRPWPQATLRIHTRYLQ